MNTLRGFLGENLLLFREPEHLARLCEVEPNLADWMRSRSAFSRVVECSWRLTKAVMDSRAAAKAVEDLMKRRRDGDADESSDALQPA